MEGMMGRKERPGENSKTGRNEETRKQCFPYMHSAAVLQNKKDMIFVGLIARVNGECKLHTVKALQ